MQSFKYSVFSVMLILGLFVAAAPALAADARLWVYVEVYDNDYDDNDFTIEVDGENADPDSFRGDEDGTRVELDEGRYEVEVRNDRDLRVDYSPECEGRIYEDDTNHCYITLRGDDQYYYPPSHTYPQFPQYTAPTYPTYTAPAINLQKGYIPRLPSTGFAPLSPLSVATALLMLSVAALFLYPHARKALTAVTR